MRDLLQLLHMRELRERSECAIYWDHSRYAHSEHIAITGDARTARALGMRDLLQSLALRALREPTDCVIY